MTSDPGVLWLAEVERKFGIADTLASCLRDRRDPLRIHDMIPWPICCAFASWPSPSATRMLTMATRCAGIRDGFPVTEGHTLVIPRRHVADYFDLHLAEREAIEAARRSPKRYPKQAELLTRHTFVLQPCKAMVAKRAGITVANIVVRVPSDEQMLKFMGRRAPTLYVPLSSPW